jgi:C-terminal processing protease CtpA/Prc
MYNFQDRRENTKSFPSFKFKLIFMVVQIKEGDVLLSVNGTDLMNLPATRLTQFVRGKVKSNVNIKVRRGDDILVLDLSRDVNRTNYFDNQEWEKAFGYGRKPSGLRTFLVL